MGWVFLAIGAVAVTLIAFVAIGQVVGRLATERPPAVYDLSDAAMWVGDRLPEEVTARLSYDDVGLVLGWHLDWFSEVGVSSRYGQELAGEEVRREGAIAPEDGAIDAVVARSLAEGGPDAVDVVCILDLQLAYLRAIGAVGDAVED
jgi:hypothetical protein